MMRRFAPILMIVILSTACGTALDCPVTAPNGETPPGEVASPYHFGNGDIFTALWPQGEIVFFQEGPGEIRPDGSLAIKFPWWRGEGVKGEIEVSGRRLDRPGRGVTAEMPSGYPDTGFRPSALVFPSEGCWEVTARVGEAELTFIVNAIKGG